MASKSYVDWKTFKATGVNLGAWLVQEANMDPDWWAEYGGTPEMDEWTWTANLGAKAAEVLEHRYATFITTDYIDRLAKEGKVTVIRIPMTYAAWLQVPGSKLYTGNQVKYMSKIAKYAIETYNMHVVIDIHGLPGGVNGLTIGEAHGHFDWFHSEENLELSFQVIQKVVDWIQASGHVESFTICPVNEPADVRDFSAFGGPDCLTEEGAAWCKKFFDGVVSLVKVVSPKIPVMLQTFKPAVYWSSRFEPDANIVFDIHNYFFYRPNVTSKDLSKMIDDEVSTRLAGDGKFPVFIGEWSIQCGGENVFDDRKENFQACRAAYEKHTSGSAMWSGRHFGNEKVSGDGHLRDYWSFENFMNLGYM